MNYGIKEVSLYNGVLDKKGKVDNIATVLSDIRQGATIAATIEHLRNTYEPKVKDFIKKSLPAVTWSGTFSKRAAKELKEYSGIICHDFDKLDQGQIDAMRGVLAPDPHVLAFFISPSGNGLKVLFAVETDASQHLAMFEAIGTILKTTFPGLEYDTHCSDISRLCFLSHDPDLYYSDRVTPYTADILEKRPALRKSRSAAPAKEMVSAMDALANVRTFTERIYKYVEGGRNKFVHAFSLNCNQAGIDKSDCLNYCYSEFSDLPPTEVLATVSGAYNKVNEWNTKPNLKKKFEPKVAGPVTKSKNDTNALNDDTMYSSFVSVDGYNDEVQFWNAHTTKNKTTGAESTKIDLSYDDLATFLANNGFYKLAMSDDSFQYIRVVNQIIEPSEPRKMREFLLAYLKSDASFKKVRELYRRRQRTYTNNDSFEGLEYFKPNFNKDTANAAFIYFKNCYYEITAKGISKKSYTELGEKHIWKKQIIQFELDAVSGDDEQPMFLTFLARAVSGHKTKETFDANSATKIQSACASIGYLLHRYKDPAMAKAVIATDGDLRENGKANGGSGKSLVGKALRQMVGVCEIDGQLFKTDATNPFEKYNVDQTIMFMNDMRKGTPFNAFYNVITDEFTFTKKYVPPITMDYTESPKWYFTFNYSFKDGGGSDLRRQHIIEFSSYYNYNNEPIDEFKARFFHDWDTAEWTRFYSFMMMCIKIFLANGLVKFPMQNYATNQLIDEIGEDAVEWFTEKIFHEAKRDRHELDDEFRIAFPNFKKEKYSAQWFRDKVLRHCAVHGLVINAHKQAGTNEKFGRDKTGNVEHWTFTKVATQAAIEFPGEENMPVKPAEPMEAAPY